MRAIKVWVNLHGYFPEIYDKHKPKDASDDDYVNAIVSSWLLDKEEKTFTQESQS